MIIAGLILTMPLAVRAAEPATHWEGFQRLEVDLETTRVDPFLEFRLPEKASSPPASEVQIFDRDPRLTDAGFTPLGSVSEAALPAKQAGNVQLQRAKLRDSLAQQGLAAAEGRDDLANEVFSVTKWTIVTLVAGTVLVIGIKQFKIRTLPLSGSHEIRLVEAFSLGRQQGLNLVEVGGERFLVATDQAGIKSVTLLPSWPRMDEPDDESDVPRIFDADSVLPGSPVLRGAA
jgi:hypothetical protein